VVDTEEVDCEFEKSITTTETKKDYSYLQRTLKSHSQPSPKILNLSLIKESPYESFYFVRNRHIFASMVSFKDGKALPEKTNLCCYYDTEQFESSPIGIPIKYIPNNKIFSVDGIFCSFNCCLSYIKQHSSDDLYRESISLLYILYENLIGSSIPKIHPSPDWKLLKKFGGPLDINEFRKSLNSSIFRDLKQHDENIVCQIPVLHLYEQINIPIQLKSNK
jgi:hypothetical protein